MDKIDRIETDEITIKQLMAKFKAALRYLKNRLKFLILLSFIGALVGMVYVFVETPNYKAVSTFVLEESSRGGGLSLGSVSSLASLAGIDIGGGSDKGLFQGDNIMELYKSRLMIEKTLLSPIYINGKSELLINRYIEANNAGWSIFGKRDNLLELNFSGNPKNFPRKQDSILRDMVKLINKRILTITKPDKKLSIISVEVKFKDEIFAALFNQTLVQNVNNFYIQTQTRKTTQTVRVLQYQVDSVRTILNSSIGRVAATSDANPNPNPTLKSLNANYQKRQIDVQANSAIYSEMVKNLEVSKVALRQETPLIQLIDEPILPLETDKTGKIMGTLVGMISGFFLGLLYLVGSRFYTFVKNS